MLGGRGWRGGGGGGGQIRCIMGDVQVVFAPNWGYSHVEVM